MSDLHTFAEALLRHPHITGKRDIDMVCGALNLGPQSLGRPGDDAAALPDGDIWHLMATEGFMNEFVAEAPWFAGWCAIMVNVSDIAAMGGRATAVTNALWAPDETIAAEILKGMAAASAAYGVPIVGGHSNLRTDRPQLAAAIWGRANALITSFDAAPGDALIAAVDLRGHYPGDSDNFPAFLGVDPVRLRGDLELLPELAEAGLVHAGKDISQGGIAGTTLMLAECSGVGVDIDVAALQRPDDTTLLRWMTTFPSFGFLLAVRPQNAAAVCDRFKARDISAGVIGKVTPGSAVVLRNESQRAQFWDHAGRPYLGLSPERKAAHA
ncbi:MAG: sll0787 family AIR synthase-like protein [Pseudomonadota bacterium]